MSGTRSASSWRSSAIVVEHVAERLARLEGAHAIDVGRVTDRVRDRRAFALDEIEVEPHRRERQQQIGKEDRGVDLDHVHRLQRDGDGELGMAADLEQGIALAQRAILRHVAAGLAHEPDRRGVDGLASAGSKEAIVHAETRVLARAMQILEPQRLEPDRARPATFSSCWIGSDRK